MTRRTIARRIGGQAFIARQTGGQFRARKNKFEHPRFCLSDPLEMARKAYAGHDGIAPNRQEGATLKQGLIAPAKKEDNCCAPLKRRTDAFSL